MKNEKVTIKDVAAAANVSVATVSFVINNRSNVKMETRVRVLQAIEETGYVPNSSARALVTNKKGVIGVIRNGFEPGNSSEKEGYAFDTSPNTYLADMLDAIVAEASKSNYNMLMDTVYWIEHMPTEKWEMPSAMDSSRIDGVLWVGGILLPSHLEKLSKMELPIVLIGARDDHFDWVDTDPEQAIYDMTKYVISCGHTKLAFINGLDSTQTSARKMSGFMKAVQEAGITLQKGALEKSYFSGQGGYEAMERLLQLEERPTAVITAHDKVAVGVIHCLNAHGLSCPQDVSVTGFEDGLLSEYCLPPLTTVYINKRRLGMSGSQILINRIANPKAKNVKLIIEPKLIIRKSVRDLK